MIGSRVMYFDYVGCECFGKIVAMEPYMDDIAYCYIEDDDDEQNNKEDIVNGTPVRYAEIRLSSEVYIDED